MKYVVVSVMLLSSLLLFNVFQAKSASPDEEVCKSYIVMFCTRCHKPERICKVLGTKTDDQWRATIKRMGDYDELDKQTRDTIFSCLSPLSLKDPMVCRK
ncbi:MAG: hypothetical protein OEM02_02140 [Desulfobulbaceae bacterium]|nr:hypothetical protein [Desulfobulbaceae bacterium]